MDRNDPPLRQWATVTQVARMLNLSRSRFYQLLREGIFMEPSRHPVTGRPIYSREQQQQCLEIKRSCCGANGRLVLFYDHPTKPSRLSPDISRARRAGPCRRRTRNGNEPPCRDPLVDDLKHGLGQLGLANIDDAAIRKALSEQYPDGWSQVERGLLLTSMFRRLRAQNPSSNLE
jgi:hypothetical protein